MASISFQVPFGSYRKVDLDFTDIPSMTHQCFAQECDINLIMARYQKTGIIEHVRSVEGRYGDFISSPDYHTAMNEIIAAQDAFDSLPSSLRARFENDPARFLDFVHDEKNRDEMIQLGLIESKVENVNSAQDVSGSIQDV